MRTSLISGTAIGRGRNAAGGGRQAWSRAYRAGIAATALAGCSPRAVQPIEQPVSVMEAPWGPFARQCATTRVSRLAYRWRIGRTEVSDTYESCMGFSVMSSGTDAAQITASVRDPSRPETPRILRVMRMTGGAVRAAAPGDQNLMAQGSDDPDAARALARDIGLTSRQLVHPSDTLDLPVRLSIPIPLDVVMACRPDGGHVARGRETLVFSCRFDGDVRTDSVNARVRLAGVEEVDVATGVRLFSELAGHLTGTTRQAVGSPWRRADQALSYQRETDLE